MPSKSQIDPTDTTDTTDKTSARNGQLDHSAVVSAYRRYGRFYDLVFGAVMEPGRRHAMSAMQCQPGDRVLEAGVGTGLSLPHYPEGVEVTGIDLSPDMLAQASARLGEHQRTNVSLMQMDVQALAFADDSFDKVAAMYVASVVPDAAAMMAELRRVCRPGGDIFVLNHFASQNRLVRRAEGLLAPLAGSLGFHPDFDLQDFIDDAGLPVVEVRQVNLFGYWTLLHLRNEVPW